MSGCFEEITLTSSNPSSTIVYPDSPPYNSDDVFTWGVSIAVEDFSFFAYFEIAFEFLSVDIEYELNCGYDAISIFSGNCYNYAYLGSVCGESNTLHLVC
jgi:hypothetical protein